MRLPFAIDQHRYWTDRRGGGRGVIARRHAGGERSNSNGTIGASFELRKISEVLTLSTCGAAVSAVTRPWNVTRFSLPGSFCPWRLMS